MKKIIFIIIIITIGCIFIALNPAVEASGSKFDPSILKEGDIIFHQSHSDQSEAVRIATNSRFSHMAIIFKYKGRFMVFEAVQPVKITSITEFARRGGNSFVIKRLRDCDSVLTPGTIEKMRAQGKKYLGKNYDYQFRWDDKRIYCSELVWKIYKYGAGIEVGRLHRAQEMNLNDPVVRRLIEKRYGKNNSIPADEIVISPQSIYDCDRLVTVYEQ
ncbi:MAG TPA: YiiX family permuted papain-like enzyme [Spirochaetota bacterium]|nr:YiiX family permuted papain-like enzyme [Spirochaetota bacterium]